MPKLITSVGCKYTGDLAEHRVVEELKSGGFREISVSHPHYQAIHKLEIKTEYVQQFVALIEMQHKETIQELSEVVKSDLKEANFEMTSIKFEIGE